jgi:hypothetical protein
MALMPAVGAGVASKRRKAKRIGDHVIEMTTMKYVNGGESESIISENNRRRRRRREMTTDNEEKAIQ